MEYQFDGDYSSIPPEGTYNVGVDLAEWKSTRDGKRFVNLILNINEGSEQGHKLFDPLYINSGAKYFLQKMQNLLRAGNVNINGVKFNEESLANALMSIRNVQCVVYHEEPSERNGHRKQARVQDYSPAPQAAAPYGS